jgi:hypothetical protein
MYNIYIEEPPIDLANMLSEDSVTGVYFAVACIAEIQRD